MRIKGQDSLAHVQHVSGCRASSFSDSTAGSSVVAPHTGDCADLNGQLTTNL